MASVVHQLSSSSEDSEGSLPDLGIQLKPLMSQEEPMAVDLTLSSDTEDIMVEATEEQPEECFTLPRYKVPRLSKEAEQPQSHETCLSDDSSDLQQPRVLQAETVTKAVKKPRMARKEREAAKQQREEEKRQRAELKRQRALEKEAERARREEEHRVRRAMKPGECLKLLVVELDRRLVEAVDGGRVLSQLQEAGMTCRVVDGKVAAAVTFFRVDPLSGKENQTEEAVVMMRVEDFVAAVDKQVHGTMGEGALCYLCEQWKAALGTPQLALVVCGVEEYLRKQMSVKRQQVSKAMQGKVRKHGSSSYKHITRVDMEMALVAAQIECSVNHQLLSDGGKAALYVLQMAKAVAEAPFKHEKAEALFSWYADGSSINSVKVDKSGVGLFKLWQQQLRQFTQVGVEVAQAVASNYPSPQSLVQAYRRCGSQREAERLLADLRVRRGAGPLASEQRVGPELSRKLHLFLTSTDPNASLAHK